MTANEVTVHSIRLSYAEAGQGRPLVCVHGNFASKRWFTELLDTPPPGWRVLALDLPNFGSSAPLPEAISIEAYARYLHGFVTALALPPLVLLGHSLGGTVAQAYAARYPETLAGLVLVSTSAPDGLKTPEAHYALLELFKTNRELLKQALVPMMPTRQPPYLEALVDDAFAMHPEAFTGNARALAQIDLRQGLQAVGCPALVLRGDLDPLITEAMARATAEALPNARLHLLTGIGHSPQVEDPVRFYGILTAFLEELP